MKLLLLTCLAGLLLTAPISVLAGEEKPLPGPKATNLAETIEYAGTSFAKKPIFKGENYDILMFAFQKGQRLEPHTIAIDAFIAVLEGTATVDIDGKEYEVTAGEMISLPKNLSHALTAKENFKMLLVK